MLKELAIILAIIVPSGGATTLEAKPMIKPPRVEENYEVVEHKPKTLEELNSDTERFAAAKERLDEKYSRMFCLEAELDGIRKDTKDIKSEYRALKRAYEREFTSLALESLTCDEQSK